MALPDHYLEAMAALAAETLRSLGRPATACEVWQAMPDPKRFEEWRADEVLEAAAARGDVVAIHGHRHDFTIQPMQCFVPDRCAGPVCQCSAGALYLRMHSSRPDIYPVTVYAAGLWP